MWLDEQCMENIQDTTVLQQLCAMKNGVVLLQGPSGCGKSGMIRALKATDPRSLRVFTVEQIRDYFYILDDSYKVNDLYNADQKWKILCFEDIDLLKGREFMMNFTASMINGFSANALVLFTGIDCETRIPTLLSQVRLPIQRFLHTSEPISNDIEGKDTL